MDNFDKKIKDRINDEIKDIPEDLSKKIEMILNDKKKNNKWKRTVAVASIGFIVFSGFGVTFTSYATGRDFKDIVYSVLGFNNNYNKYATGLNEEQSSEGIKVTITSCVFDGYKVNIAYKLEVDNDNIIDSKKSDLQTGDLGDAKIKINNKNINVSSSKRWDLDKEGNYVGVLSYDIDEKMLSHELGTNIVGKNAKNFNVKIDISKNIDGKEANWKFNIPISNEKLRKDIKEYNINKSEDEINLESIVVTPLSIYVKGNLEKNYEGLKVVLEDNKGKKYDAIARHIIGESGKYRFRFEFDNKIKDSKSIKAKIFYNEKELKKLEMQLDIK